MNIIFDLDGTLIDSSERLYRLFQNLVPESNFSKKEYWSLKRNKINHETILKKFFPEINFEIFNSRWLSLIESDEYLAMDRLYHDTVKTLKILSRDYFLILLTARQSREKLISELKRFKIYEFFNLILITEAKISKENLLNEAINSGLFLKSENDFFISDVGKDILIGRKLFFKTIGITHGFMNQKNLADYKPHFLIENLSEIFREKKIETQV